MAEPPHVENYRSNHAEVIRLIEIHTQLGGATPGRKHKMEVLNKSGIVLLVACWEAYVEDLVATAFDRMLTAATSPNVFPDSVLTLSTKELKKSLDDREIWKLSGDGWKSVLKTHRDHVFKRHVGNFNTPKADQIDGLFLSLLGLKTLSNGWKWQGMGVRRQRKLTP